MEIFEKWLDELAKNLHGISFEDREDILESYREQMNEMLCCGVSETDILSKLGSPKKVAKEVLDSLLPDVDTEEPTIIQRNQIQESHLVKRLLPIAVIGGCLLIAIGSLFVMARLVMGGLIISTVSVGLMIAILFGAMIPLNLAVTSGYIGLMARNSHKRGWVRKKGIERYLIVSSVVAIIVGSAVFVGSIYTNPILKQSFFDGRLFDLLEVRSHGLLDFDDLFEIDLD